MITYVQGDLFVSPATVLVNTVNTIGVMGKGIAKDFKAYFPDMFRKYQEACEAGELRIGTLQFFRTPHKSVLNFPTKRHWRGRSRIEDIEAGLKAFVARYEDLSISSIAFPQLGCGNGELDWETQVRPLMERYLAPLPIEIYIHLYDVVGDFVEHREPAIMKQWLNSQPEALPFAEFWDDLKALIRASSDHSSWRVAQDGCDLEEEVLINGPDAPRIRLTTQELRSIWQQLRSFGLLSSEDIAGPDVVDSEAVLDLLERLDYIEPVRLGTLRSGASESSTEMLNGIRLVPPVQVPAEPGQLELVGIGQP